MKIYNNVQGKEAILHNNDYGPTFKCCIYLGKDFSNNQNYTWDKNNANQYFSGFNRDYELNDGERYFSLAEIEVFQVLLE